MKTNGGDAREGRTGGGGEGARFLCLCMAPALDATVSLPRAPAGRGEIFKDVAGETVAGGKGLNVARWLALRGASVACRGLLGEDNAAPFAREMARFGVEDRLLRVPGATRVNEMVAWPGGCFKLNRPPFPGLDPERAREVLDGLGGPEDAEGGSVRVAILSGSLPAAVPPDFYARAVERLRARGWTTVLDASGEALRLGVEAGPDLVKPNADECEALVGFVPRSPDEFRRATDALRRRAGSVVVSDGARGAWFDGEPVPAPAVEAADTTAAGDTLLAEYCWRTWGGGAAGRGPGAPSPARWAVAAGSAACTMPGGRPPPPGLVERLARGA